MIRRTFLSGGTGLISLASAGCLSGSGSRSTEKGNQDGDEQQDEEQETEDFNPDVEQVTRLGEASSVSFEVAPDWEYEYIEASDSVRIQYDSGDSSTMAFGKFGTLRAADHSSDRLQQILEDNSLTGTGISTGWGRTGLNEIDTPTNETTVQEEVTRDAPMAPKVYHTHHYARDGSLISEPAVPFENIVEAVPNSMEVTMLFPEKNYTAVLPVVCTKDWVKNE